VGPRAGLNVVAKTERALPCPFLESNPGLPVSSLVTMLID